MDENFNVTSYPNEEDIYCRHIHISKTPVFGQLEQLEFHFNFGMNGFIGRDSENILPITYIVLYM